MGKLDESEYKYKNWVLTVSPTKSVALMSITDLTKTLKQVAESWVFQEEKASNTHYQCCLKTKIRVRQSTLLNKLTEASGLSADLFTVDRMQGDWDSAVAYCTKQESRLSGPYYSDITLAPYMGEDVAFLEDKDLRYSWQNSLLKMLLTENEEEFLEPNDREIIWIEDSSGCTGKSKLVKYLYMKYPSVSELSFGSSNQLRTALISIGPKRCYFIDIPRTLGEEDSMSTLYSVLEKLKGGFITSTMYGKYGSLLMPPPHIVVFSNSRPKLEALSADRWRRYSIIGTSLYIKDAKDRVTPLSNDK